MQSLKLMINNNISIMFVILIRIGFSEYVYNNPKISQIKDIIEKTRLKQDQKHGIDCGSEVKINFIVKVFDQINNKTKIITTKKI